MGPGRTRLTVSGQASATALRLRFLCASAQTAKAPLPALLAFGKPHLPSSLRCAGLPLSDGCSLSCSPHESLLDVYEILPGAILAALAALAVIVFSRLLPDEKTTRRFETMFGDRMSH